MAQGMSRIGCAGWSLPAVLQGEFGAEGSHLERYGARLNACEINSSFYRPHGFDTYRRWGDSVPAGFRFSVKLPQAITHDSRLAGCDGAIGDFLAQAQGLGDKLSCVLVQLPPSLAFDAQACGDFFEALRARWDGGVACEPRHASWFTSRADALLRRHRVARVLADPVRHAAGAMPGGYRGLTYLRLHGSPRVYYSAYPPDLIAALAARIRMAERDGTEVWCMFDNTASGAAAGDALALQRALQQDPP